MTNHYSIWLLPSDNDQNYFHKIITKLSTEYEAPVFLPHCTLFSPLDSDGSDSEKLLMHVANQFRPFNVRARKLEFSSNIWKTLYIELEKSSMLTELQQCLISLIPDPKPYEFQPHISLIYKEMSKMEKEQIIQNIFIREFYKMDKISIMKTGLDIVNWKKTAEIQLYA